MKRPDDIPAKTLAELEWPAIIEELARRAATERGEATARALPFLESTSDARAQMLEIGEARGLLERNEAPPFGDIRPIDEALVALEREGALDAHDIIDVAVTVTATSRLGKRLHERIETAPRLAALGADMPDLNALAEPITEAFDESRRLRDGASRELGRLRREVTRLQGRITRRMGEMLRDSRVTPSLQDNFYTEREGRYVLPIKVDAPFRLEGIVHATSQTGHTLFIEPAEIVETNNRLKMAVDAVAREERRILAEFCERLGKERLAILRSIEIASRIDLLIAAARLAGDLGATTPEVADDGDLELPKARHPLLALVPSGCVSSQLEVPSGTVLIVSGPNAGGKTVALKSIGLAALMVRAGLPICAGDGARVPWYRAVWTDIADDQSIARSLSTFSAHLLHLREALSFADARTLLLMDEIAVGTDPDQGAALAQATLEQLATQRVPTVVTTHYERLKLLAAQDARFRNASVGYDFERLEPTFRIQLGVPGASGALLVARRMDLSVKVVERAESLLGSGQRDVERLLEQIDRERREARREKEAAVTARSEAEARQRAAESLERDLQDRLTRLRRSARDEVVDRLRRARVEIDEIHKAAKKASRPGELPVIKARLRDVSTEIASLPVDPPETSEPGPAARVQELQPGIRVRLRGLSGIGQVLAAPKGGRVSVQIGSARTTVPTDDVILARGKEAREQHRARGPSSPPSESEGPTDTLDLRGARIDDGVGDLERFLNASYLSAIESVRVIHGHGTGALKAAVREHLTRHPLVVGWHPGTAEEGGDGVTFVELDT